MACGEPKGSCASRAKGAFLLQHVGVGRAQLVLEQFKARGFEAKTELVFIGPRLNREELERAFK